MSNDVIYLYTDGVTEVENKNIEGIFSRKSLFCANKYDLIIKKNTQNGHILGVFSLW